MSTSAVFRSCVVVRHNAADVNMAKVEAMHREEPRASVFPKLVDTHHGVPRLATRNLSVRRAHVIGAQDHPRCRPALVRAGTHDRVGGEVRCARRWDRPLAGPRRTLAKTNYDYRPDY